MEEDLKIKALVRSELGLVEELEGQKESKWYAGLRVLDLCPWKAYGIPGQLVALFTYDFYLNGWQGHMYANSAIRGLQAKKLFKKALEMFLQDTGQKGVLGVTPKEFKSAVVMARALGFKRIRETDELIISFLSKEDL